MKNIIIAFVCALLVMVSGTASAQEVLVVKQPYKTGIVKSISIGDGFAVVSEANATYTFPLAEGAIIDDDHIIDTITVENGEVVLAAGSCPKWVGIAVIAIIVALCIGALVKMFRLIQ